VDLFWIQCVVKEKDLEVTTENTSNNLNKMTRPCSSLLLQVLCLMAIVATSAFVPLVSTSRSSQWSQGVGTTQAAAATTTTLYASSSNFNTKFMWNAGLNFGKGDFKFYESFDTFMGVFPNEDKAAFPEIFNLPKGLYEVRLAKPLGVIFEEIEIGRGVYVQDLVEGGNAARSGMIQINDVLVGITAIKIVGAKYERRMIPARKFDFDTVVGAIQSNDSRYQCNDVVLMLERPGEADSKQVDEFMSFFEPPFDNPWKQRQ
jgi:hypothetical protein